MSVDSQSGPGGPVTGRVQFGGCRLEVGGAGGTLIFGDPDQEGSAELARAIADGEREDARSGSADTRRGAMHEGADALATTIDSAGDVTSKIERAVKLFTELAEGRRDPSSLSDEVDALLALLQRLDRSGRREEALRLARALTGVLALVGRWMELARSLHTALRLARGLGQDWAWAEHELGTLHLGVGNARVAEHHLSQARQIRQQINDRAGLAATDHNLQGLCRLLRKLVRRRESRLEKFARRPVLAALAAAVLLAGGGVAGAMVNSSTSEQPSAPATPNTPVSPGDHTQGKRGDKVAAFIPDSVDFGAVAINDQGSQDVRARNVGAVPITLGSVSVTADSDEFKESDDGCSHARLEPDATCTVSVAFAPLARSVTKSASGSAATNTSTTATSSSSSTPTSQTRNGTLTFSDTGTGKPGTVQLVGTATRGVG